MKNKILKLCLFISLFAILISCFASCGGSAPSDIAKTEIGDTGLEWSYTAENNTLTITGAGDIPDYEMFKDKNSKVAPWYSIRTSVKTVKFVVDPDENTGVKNVGDFAFYGMTNLTSIVDADFISLGKCAFAFCSKLESVTLPKSLKTIGEAAFEGCFALKSITVPESVTELESRIFASCKALELVIVKSQDIDSIPAFTFYNCSALKMVAVDNYTKDMELGESAFERAGIKAPVSRDATVTVSYKVKNDENNEDMPGADKFDAVIGESFTVPSKEIEGYEVDKNEYKLYVDSADEKITVYYNDLTPGEKPDQTPSDNDNSKDDKDEEKDNTGAIIAIVILGVLIVALCVGIVIFARSSKKNAQGNNTKAKNAKPANNANAKAKKNSKKK